MSQIEMFPDSLHPTTSRTVRQQIHDTETSLYRRLAELEKAKTFLPTAWLDLTDEQLKAQYGICLYF